jgi:hypothetical protein
MKSIEWELERVNWAQLRTSVGNASSVPGALRSLVSATTEEEARWADRRLDNRVVVQGNRFQAAEYVILPLLAALPDCADIARVYVLDLLVELTGADEDLDEGEVKAGNTLLAQHCIERLRAGLAIFYRCLDDSNPRVRDGALELIDATDPDDDRVLWFLDRLAQRDEAPKIRDLAARRAIERRAKRGQV